MQTLFVLLIAWAKASIGLKILDILAIIAFFVLFVVVPGGKTIPGTEEFVPNLGCGAKIVVSIICIAILLFFLQFNGTHVFW